MSTMSESPIRVSLMRTKFLATGGIILGTTAIAFVIGIPVILHQRDEHTDDDGSLIDANPTKTFSMGKHLVTKSPSIAPPCIMPSQDLLPIITKPTHRSRESLPTLRTTSIEVDVAAVAKTTRHLNNIFDEDDSFRLKLYWEPGYYWQENTDEKWWCMTCAGDCKSGSIIKIRDCKKKSNADVTFVVSSPKGDTRKLRAKVPKPPNAGSGGGGGYQYRLTNSDLCLTVDRANFVKVGPDANGIAITLSSCKTNDPSQLFVAKASEKFDIRPVTLKDRCLTQHHHPKSDEIVFVESCTKAHASETGYWSVY